MCESVRAIELIEVLEESELFIIPVRPDSLRSCQPFIHAVLCQADDGIYAALRKADLVQYPTTEAAILRVADGADCAVRNDSTHITLYDIARHRAQPPRQRCYD
jgi:hypothetical protein